MTVLVTGADGLLGSKVVERFSEVVATSKEDLDVRDIEAARECVTEEQPDVIIHLAALTSVRKCAEEKDLAWETNVEGTANMVQVADEVGAKFVLMSTPCVFSGEDAPYTEQSVPDPKNFYGVTKMVAENIVRHGNWQPDWLIVRGNFVEKAEWPYPEAFVDRYSNYLFADQIAGAIKELLEAEMEGTVHVVGDERMSMYELARITTPDVGKITLEEYEGPPLTRDMGLATERWHEYSIDRE